MDEENQITGEAGADSIVYVDVPEHENEAAEAVEEVYEADKPQLAEPLKPRTTHFAFRRGRN